jgi:hypothetical protein
MDISEHRGRGGRRESESMKVFHVLSSRSVVKVKRKNSRRRVMEEWTPYGTTSLMKQDLHERKKQTLDPLRTSARPQRVHTSARPRRVHTSPNMPTIQPPFDFQQVLTGGQRSYSYSEGGRAPLRRLTRQLPSRVTPDVSWRGCLGMESWQVLMNQET